MKIVQTVSLRSVIAWVYSLRSFPDFGRNGKCVSNDSDNWNIIECEDANCL